MSLEDLTKTQLILLGLLLSFVSSIATSIITTGLLAEAPLQTTQTINRIVQNTVEKVVPGEVITEQKTTITVESNEGDLIAKIYEEVVPMVYQIEDADNNKVKAFSVNSNLLVYAESFVNLRLPKVIDGEVSYDLSFDEKYYGLEIRNVEDQVSVLSMSIGMEQNPKVGETVVLVDPNKLSLFDSRVSSVIKSDDGSVSNIYITDSIKEVGLGSVVMDLEGKVMGFVGKDEAGVLVIVPVGKIVSL